MSNITLESVEGRILSSLFHHNNFPAYDFQIASRINSDEIPEKEFNSLMEAGLIEKTSSYKLSNKGLQKVKDLTNIP
jgi:hypothetical protein